MTRDDIYQSLERLTHRARVGFAAECARRVLVIYKVTWDGERVPSGPRIAVDTAHDFATHDQPADVARIERARDAVNQAFPPSELGGGVDHVACAAAAYALDAIGDPTPEAAWTASAYALDAIAQVDENGGAEEERAWQKQLLQRLLTLPLPALVPAELLSASKAVEPEWLRRFMN